MGVAKNYPIPRNHFHKHWQERVRVHLDQAGGKARRRLARAKKAAAIAPRPLDLLRPIVRCPTLKYNRKVRAGRGFTLEEVKAAGFTPKFARTIGIAVDHRRKNGNVEGFEANVARLKEYKSKLVVFPRKSGKSKSGDSSAEEVAAASQTISVKSVFPVVQTPAESGARAISSEAQTTEAYRTLRDAQSIARFAGIREKRAREKADAEADKKK
ncbi:hypothetical protein CANCADRAFT_128660 [Tortispora caseinolytica NRRL Y-17796]|uniref:60S ribosomal protein L13 n=1 Tax=Tortispora caseinolytica NRRL Y-17796 TaxID=767744 RepID=A0A1E4TAK8_9ASCO|nr:hypothetical protein CANCADRAFT_128660 [Tortispora caseinolytica NRRL Y-17796]